MTDFEQPITPAPRSPVGRRPRARRLLSACADDERRRSAPQDESRPTAPAAAARLRPHARADGGPYYLDLDLVRSDITEGRPGSRSTSASPSSTRTRCEPIEGAAVDVWHCDAGGAYSGVQGAEGETFCRGVQMTDRRRRRVPHGLPRLVHGPRGAHPREGEPGRRRDAHRPALLRPGGDLCGLRARAVRRARRAGRRRTRATASTPRAAASPSSR